MVKSSWGGGPVGGTNVSGLNGLWEMADMGVGGGSKVTLQAVFRIRGGKLPRHWRLGGGGSALRSGFLQLPVFPVVQIFPRFEEPWGGGCCAKIPQLSVASRASQG